MAYNLYKFYYRFGICLNAVTDHNCMLLFKLAWHAPYKKFMSHVKRINRFMLSNNQGKFIKSVEFVTNKFYYFNYLVPLHLRNLKKRVNLSEKIRYKKIMESMLEFFSGYSIMLLTRRMSKTQPW